MDLAALLFSPWGWIVLGGALLALEIAVPGASLIWLGIAAILTGLLTFAVTLGWDMQIVVFAILAIVAVVAGRRMAPKPGQASDRPFLNRRTEAYVGRVFTLEQAMESGAGVVRIEDTIWRVEGPDLPAGTTVRVVRAEGPVLYVEPAPPAEPVSP